MNHSGAILNYSHCNSIHTPKTENLCIESYKVQYFFNCLEYIHARTKTREKLLLFERFIEYITIQYFLTTMFVNIAEICHTIKEEYTIIMNLVYKIQNQVRNISHHIIVNILKQAS